MLIGEHAVTIARPIRAVFEHVVDGARNASWRGPDLTVTLLSGDGGVGSVWQQQVRGFGGRPVEVEYRVTALEPPRRFAYELTAGPARGEAEYLLDARSAELTTVSLRVRMRPRGLFASWTGVVPRQVSSELDSLDRLRNFLEGGGVVAS
jgi:uncharacterized protein YndB with AHSA1/START domain